MPNIKNTTDNKVNYKTKSIKLNQQQSQQNINLTSNNKTTQKTKTN